MNPVNSLAQILWAFFLIFQLVAAAFVFFIFPVGHLSMDVFTGNPPVLALFAIAVGNIVLGFNVHRLAMRPGGVEVTKGLTAREQMRTQLLPYILRLALIDIATMAGVVAAAFVQNAMIALPFMALAIGGLFASFPSTPFLRKLRGES